MEVITFTTNHGMKYAVLIKDLLAVIEPGEIFVPPGCPDGIAGITKFRDQIIPVIDTAMLYENRRGEQKLMLVMQGQCCTYGVLIKEVSDIIRDGKLPEEVRFLDPNDYVNSVLVFDKDVSRVDLF